MPTAAPLTFIVVWFLAAVFVRLAVVVVRRERASHRVESGSMAGSAEDGSLSVQLAALTAAALATGYAVVVSVGIVAGPPDEFEMSTLVDDVAASFADESAEERPDPDVDDVRDAVSDAGGDPDDFDILTVADGWQQLEPGGVDGGVRFQLVTTDGDEAQCLEVTWYTKESGGSGFVVSGLSTSDLC